MARADTYSRMVLWLKVALPLVALAILSTLFLVAETLDPEAAIPYADVDVDRIIEEQGVTRPAFGGVTSDGVRVSLSADTVRPNGGNFLGQSLDVELIFSDGGVIDLVSPQGSIDMSAEQATLSGGVHLESTNGYAVTTEQVTAAWSRATVETAGTVIAEGPAGRIEAGQMSLTTVDGGEAHLLVFNNGVRLVYVPEP